MRPVASTVAALALLIGLAGCKPSTVTDTSRHLYCQVVVDSPDRDDDTNPKKIVGRVRYYCDQPGADTLALTIRLQRQNSHGTWVDVARTSFTASKGQTIQPEDEIYRKREITVGCTTGVFRVQVSGSSKARGFTDRHDLTGPRNSDPCRPSLFAS